MTEEMVLSKEDANRLEQRTLTVSLYAVVVAIMANLSYGLYIKSDALILNGIFALLNLAGSSLNLIAAKMVLRPADRDFQYGYSLVEPLVNCFNGLMMLILCLYAFINGIEGIRHGGHKVDASDVVWFTLLASLFCLAMWSYKKSVYRKVSSKILKHDTEKWTIKLSFHLVTLFGFSLLPFLSEPYRNIWQTHADSSLVAVMALLMSPIPIRIIKSNVRELLLMSTGNEAVRIAIEQEMQKIKSEYDITRYATHVAQVGRSNLIKVNILTGPDFQLQSIEEQDRLRHRIWSAINKSEEEGSLSVCITADPRWITRSS